MLKAIFKAHPQSVGETYWEHQAVALSFAKDLIAAGFACLVHAFVPALCVTTGSRAVARLHERMIAQRSRAQASGTVIAASPTLDPGQPRV